jgi:hypothetical protein
VKALGSTTITLYSALEPIPLVASDLRVKIIKPMWNWVSSDGYLGAEANHGYMDSITPGLLGLPSIFGDEKTQEFVSPPIEIPSAITNPEARVWFANTYSVSDDNLNHSSGITGGTGVFGPRKWTNFTDRKFFVPVYPHAGSYGWGTMSFDSSKHVVLTSGTTVQNNAGVGGVKCRFKVFPDLTTKRIKFILTFGAISLPLVSVANTESSAWGLFFQRSTGQFVGLACYTYTTKNQIAIVSGSSYNDAISVVSGQKVDLAATNPLPATSLVLTTTIDAAISSGGAVGEYIDTSYYNVDGGGNIQLGPYSPDNQPNGFGCLSGYELFIGVIAGGRFTATTGTITQLEMVEGLGVLCE